MSLLKRRSAKTGLQPIRLAAATGLIGSMVGAATLFGPAGIAGAGPIDMSVANDRGFGADPQATTVPDGACYAKVRAGGTRVGTSPASAQVETTAEAPPAREGMAPTSRQPSR